MCILLFVFVLLCSLLTWTKLTLSGKREPQLGILPPSYWRVDECTGYFDWWWIWECLDHSALVILDGVKKAWWTIQGEQEVTVFLQGFYFGFPSCSTLSSLTDKSKRGKLHLVGVFSTAIETLVKTKHSYQTGSYSITDMAMCFEEDCGSIWTWGWKRHWILRAQWTLDCGFLEGKIFEQCDNISLSHGVSEARKDSFRTFN